jgi:glycosyltransferase involved in cell wall biosynthesis
MSKSAGRIVIVLPALSAGGSEQAVSAIASTWAARGRDVSVVTFEPPGTPVFHPLHPNVSLEQLGLPIQNNGPMRGLYNSARRVARLRALFRRIRPGVVISFLTRTNIVSLLAARGLGFPVVVSERNNPELQAFGPVWDWLRRTTYPKAFGLVTMTRGAMETFPPDLRRRSWVIPNQIVLPRDLAVRRDGTTLAAVGRLVPQKGFDLLLPAFARIAATHPAWKLVIWGEGPERERLEALRSRLGLEGRVEFPGVTERAGGWIETTDVFVLSSRYEGWGIVLLEAMAAGLPVVSFDCNFGPADMITNETDGLLVPNGDVEALAAALSRMLGDADLRRRLGDAAAASARRFESGPVMARWDEVVREALG